jgi:hypothetical protein
LSASLPLKPRAGEKMKEGRRGGRAAHRRRKERGTRTPGRRRVAGGGKVAGGVREM